MLEGLLSGDRGFDVNSMVVVPRRLRFPGDKNCSAMVDDGNVLDLSFAVLVNCGSWLSVHDRRSAAIE